MNILKPENIRELSSLEFREAYAELQQRFREANATVTAIAKELGKFETSCAHRNRRRTGNDCAWWCSDCEQYFGVDVSYAPETEEFFRKLKKSQ